MNDTDRHAAATTGARRALSAIAQAPAPTSTERRDECFAAIDAMVDQIARLRAEMTARDVAAAEACNAATAMRHERDRYRAALARIAAHDDSSWQGALARIALDHE